MTNTMRSQRAHLRVLLPLGIFLLLFPALGNAQKLKERVANRAAEQLDYPHMAAVYEDLVTRGKAEPADMRRLALAYRKMGQPAKAEAVYLKLMGTGAQTPDDVFAYAEQLRANGKYADALEWYGTYAALRPEDGRAQHGGARLVTPRPSHPRPAIPGARGLEADGGQHLGRQSTVTQGDLLVRFDTSTEEAQLRALEARVEWAQTNLARIESLRIENTLSQAELDQAELELTQNQANADAVRATIAKKTIRAPFAGVLGIRQISQGSLITPGTVIVSLDDISRVYVDFPVPESQLSHLANGQVLSGSSVAWPDVTFEGAVSVIDARVDEATRSVVVRGDFPNAEHRLPPGMLLQVVLLRPERQALVVPELAVV